MRSRELSLKAAGLGNRFSDCRGPLNWPDGIVETAALFEAGRDGHFILVEWIDRGVLLRSLEEILERHVLGDALAEVGEHSHVALDDHAGVFLVQVVVAIDG